VTASETSQAGLARKTWRSFAWTLAVLGVLLFLPAGTLGYWQAWSFLLVFGLGVAVVTAYFLRHDPKLVESRLRAGPAAETRPRQRAVQSCAALLAVAALVVPGLDRRFGWSRVPPGVAIAGDAFIAAAFAVVFLVFRENRFTSAVVELRPEQTVVETGPYRVVRHPLYSAALLMFLFTPLALGSYWGMLVLPPIFAALALRLLDEERLLEADLPGYREYKTRTRYRLIPFVW
jgi:protein-S-isoprenylcysteine O-methyltransferase Ste14